MIWVSSWKRWARCLIIWSMIENYVFQFLKKCVTIKVTVPLIYQNIPPLCKHTSAVMDATIWSSSGSPQLWQSLIDCHSCLDVLKRFKILSFINMMTFRTGLMWHSSTWRVRETRGNLHSFINQLVYRTSECVQHSL